MNFENNFIGTFFQIWISSQVDLNKVKRWKPYYKDGIGKRMRRQNVLQHTHSFSLFAGTVAQMLNPFIFSKTGRYLDLLLLEYAFKWHDHPEGLKGRDIAAPKKRDEDDVEEYSIFMEHIKDLPESVKDEYEYAFLLQFALCGNKLFPDNAQELMKDILDNFYYEALTFSALEKFEYLFYPIEMEKQHKHLLTWVLSRQIPGYHGFVKTLPGFREILFTESLEEQLLDYLKENESVPALKL